MASLDQKGYKTTEVKSFEKLELYVNNVLSKKEVVFFKNNNVFFGFIFFEDSDRPNFFLTDENNVTLFLTEPASDGENLFLSVLNNHYSAYYMEFSKREVYYVNFLFMFKPSLPHFTIYCFGENKYDEFTASSDRRISYPDFTDRSKTFSDYSPLKNIKIEKLKKVKEGISMLNLRPSILNLFIDISH
ncbi:hypothetical protein B0A68_17160 [Flavobacterium reichenbachii]|uniref:Uncharacterized protein n=1 Tax=Flavobacterium reichenbachii TaxID=362418 RepID=A0A085ZHZ3_9FLAO|nr:hypothetical protein IW19_00250 [Flavobacterium reichenbachii]OXB12891.1 hypothetical protein B0A68_17160 [Flavobacterium reichenbachii]